MVCHCGHAKTLHESARDSGTHMGRCTLRWCNCTHYRNKALVDDRGYYLQ